MLAWENHLEKKQKILIYIMDLLWECVADLLGWRKTAKYKLKMQLLLTDYTYPLFVSFCAVRLYSISSRGIRLTSSLGEWQDWDLQSLIFKLCIRYILTNYSYSDWGEFFMFGASTFLKSIFSVNRGNSWLNRQYLVLRESQNWASKPEVEYFNSKLLMRAFGQIWIIVLLVK